MSNEEKVAAIAATRRARFNDVLDGYECGAGEWSVPVRRSREEAQRALPQSRVPVGDPNYHVGRFAVVTEKRGFGYFVETCNRTEHIARVAGENYEGSQPVCYFDLDILAGEEPILMEGDRVRYNGAERVVSHHDYEAADGEPYPVIYLEPVDAPSHWAPEGPIDPENDDVELIERERPDDRMPVRYGVALIKVVVAFNTIPSP